MFFVKKEMLLLNKKTIFGGVSWCYGTIVGSLFRGGSRIFLREGGGEDAVVTCITTIFTAFHINSSTSSHVLLQL